MLIFIWSYIMVIGKLSYLLLELLKGELDATSA